MKFSWHCRRCSKDFQIESNLKDVQGGNYNYTHPYAVKANKLYPRPIDTSFVIKTVHVECPRGHTKVVRVD